MRHNTTTAPISTHTAPHENVIIHMASAASLSLRSTALFLAFHSCCVRAMLQSALALSDLDLQSQIVNLKSSDHSFRACQCAVDIAQCIDVAREEISSATQ